MNYLKKRIAAFSFAFKGIFYLFSHESHAIIHLFAAVVVIVGGFLFRINAIEWCIISICIGSVFMAEAFNTAIEKLADKISLDKDPLIGIAKDLSAGAVLLFSISTIIVAAIIFIPKF
ncbi:MAG: diacylglycerol kinase family protein [Muribaculaceae bacterium]|nr:diacylglycerol kinase family protein [Muribaculaceae bacterium]